jgi:hypothetical protein
MNTTRENIWNSIKALGMKVLPKDAQLILFGSQARKNVPNSWEIDYVTTL